MLALVAWNMVRPRSPAWRATCSTGVVLLAAFLVTILHDLTAGIASGCILTALFWTVRRAQARTQ